MNISQNEKNQKLRRKNINDQQLMNKFVEQKGTVFGKAFHIIDAPQIIEKISDIRRLNVLNTELPLKNITERLLSKEQKPSHSYKINEQRNKYSKLNNQVQFLLHKIDNCQNLNLSDIMLYKQQILGSFLGNIVEQVKFQCRQRGNLLDYLWKEIFLLLQTVLKSLSKENKNQQRQNLKQAMIKHQKYQQLIEQKQKKITKMQNQHCFMDAFNKTLIHNLRIKKKEIKHLYGQIKSCTDMLNQYKTYYLDLQAEHIELLMENRQISRDNAIYLLKRKHQILADKKKAFKSKFTQKNNLKKITAQLQKQKEGQKNKVQRQVRELFAKQFQETQTINKQFPKLSNFLFQEALEEFNYYSLDFAVDQMINMQTKTTFVEIGTDMQGAQFNLQCVQTQVEYIDKIINQMSRNRGDQTIQQEKVKQKRFAQSQTQVQEIDLKKLELKINRVINQSFLFQGKSQKIRLKTISSKKQIQKSQKKIAQKSSYKNIKIGSKSIFYQKNEQDSTGNNSRTAMNSPMRISIRKSRSSLFLQSQRLNELKREYDDDNKNIEPNALNDQIDFIDEQQQTNAIKFVSKKLKQKKKNTYFDKENQNNSISIQTMRNNFKERISSRFKPEDFQFQPEKPYQTLQKKVPSLHEISIKKKLKKHVFIKQQVIEQSKPQEQKLQMSPQKKEFMKIFQKNSKNIAIDENVHINVVKKIKQQIKQQNPDLFLDQNMDDYLKSKKFQSQQTYFKNMSQWIKPLIQDINIYVKNTSENKKKLLPRRYKHLCKILSLVYNKAYQLLQKNQKIYSLINPLFQYFQIGYGIMKKYHLYSRMVTFLSQVYLYKQQYHILYSFYFFVGIQKQNALSQKISSSDVHLYLKLLKSLSFGFTIPLNILNIYTSNVMLFKNAKLILLQEKIHVNIVQKILHRVHQKLQSLTGVDLRPQNTDKNIKNLDKLQTQGEQIKLDVFKCAQLIIQQIIRIKVLIEQSYTQLIQFMFDDQIKDRVDQSLIKFIIKCQFGTKSEEFKFYEVLKNMFYLSSLYYQYKKTDLKSQKNFKTLRNIRTCKQIEGNNYTCLEIMETQTLSLSDMCNFFLKINILDFNKTFFNSLYKFKLRQDMAYGISRQNRIKIGYVLNQNKKYSVQNVLYKEIEKSNESKSTVKQMFCKKVLVLLNFRIVEDEADSLVNDIIGKQLCQFNHKITLMIN